MEDSSTFVGEVEAWAHRLAAEAPSLRPHALAVCGLPDRMLEQIVGPDPRWLGSWEGGQILVADRLLVFMAGETPVPAREASLPARVTRALGLTSLLAAGCGSPVSAQARDAECLVVSDHLNLRGDNPLVGPNHESWGVRFPDMSEPYDPALRALAVRAGAVEGVVAEAPEFAWKGLDAPDEVADAGLVRLAAALGADALGYGFVPLSIGCAHAGLPFAALMDLTTGREAVNRSFSQVLTALLRG